MKKNNVKVSVITYVYASTANGRADVLKDALASVANQSYPSYEHIIVDDGSEVELSGLVDQYPCTRLVKKKNTGILSSTETFNLGHKIAEGEFCIYLPSDDVQLEGAISGLVDALERNCDAELAVGRAIYELASGRSTLWVPDTEAIPGKMLQGNYVNGCAAMWRRTPRILTDLPPNYTGFCSDYDLFATLSLTSRVIFPNIDVVRYREVPDSTRRSTRSSLIVSPRSGDRNYFQYTKAARVSFVQTRILRRNAGFLGLRPNGENREVYLECDYSASTVFPMVVKRQWQAAATYLTRHSPSFSRAVQTLRDGPQNNVWELTGSLHISSVVLMQLFRETHAFEPWIDDRPDSWYFEFLPIPAISIVRNRSGEADLPLTRYLGLGERSDAVPDMKSVE